MTGKFKKGNILKWHNENVFVMVTDYEPLDNVSFSGVYLNNDYTDDNGKGTHHDDLKKDDDLWIKADYMTTPLYGVLNDN